VALSSKLYGGRVVLTGGTDSLLTLLQVVDPAILPALTFNVIQLRADKANVGTTYWSEASTVTTGNTRRCGYLDAGEAESMDNLGHVHLDFVFLAGTVGDALFVWCCEY
jgi:hypothetical protein